MDWSNIIKPQLKSDLDEILTHAAIDFTANVSGEFKLEDLEQIIKKAALELFRLIQEKSPQSHAELALLWHNIVVDFHQHDQWGFVTSPPGESSKPKTQKVQSSHQKLSSYARTFLVPTLLLKASILYFGLNYSHYPDEGYGWGLIVAIILSLINFSIFLWKTRNDTDDDL